VATVRDGVIDTFLVHGSCGAVEQEGGFAAEAAGLAAAVVPVAGVGPVETHRLGQPPWVAVIGTANIRGRQ
jgi:hypothetical protein